MINELFISDNLKGQCEIFDDQIKALIGMNNGDHLCVLDIVKLLDE